MSGRVTRMFSSSSTNSTLGCSAMASSTSQSRVLALSVHEPLRCKFVLGKSRICATLIRELTYEYPMKWRSLEESSPDINLRSLAEVLLDRKQLIEKYVPADVLAIHQRV